MLTRRKQAVNCLAGERDFRSLRAVVWTLSVAPVEGWGNPGRRWSMVAWGLLLSVLLAYHMKLLLELQAHKKGLESLVARQHASLLRLEGQMESLELQLQGIELQLDGVDYLSQQVRDELGLAPSAGTWEGTSPADARGGGTAFSDGIDDERLGLARRRLAVGLQELTGLLDLARGGRWFDLWWATSRVIRCSTRTTWCCRRCTRRKARNGNRCKC